MSPGQPVPARVLPSLVLIAAAAMVMGAPTLRGSFVGGDDHRLVLNHVLVNHPSWSHAGELFTIVHRDLYQPLPLLTFSGEFLLANVLGLFRGGAEGGAWLFHLTNVLLHAINSILVFFLIRKLHVGTSPGDDAESLVRKTPPVAVATVTALLFAVHPFQVETVAWVNGRMMLLSTLFALSCILLFLRWLERGRAGLVFLVVLLAVLSAISKVRAPLVLLLGLATLLRGKGLTGRFWIGWIPVAVATAFFAWVNIGATAQADLFSEGAEHLQGPRMVRVLLAVAFYFQHLVWPVGLTSYYPTPPSVAWSDSGIGSAILTLLIAGGILALLARRSRAGLWGAVWFFVAIADTLPFFPARNVLAADRYMYLPIIGLLWAVSAGAVDAFGSLLKNRSATARRVSATGAAAAVLPALIGTSWFTAGWYNTTVLKTQRVADCFPDEPRVWEMLGWTYHQLGQYDKAIECARKELRHKGALIRSGAYQLMGLAELRRGNADEALRLLREAIVIDPTDDMGPYRLAVALDELGRLEEALPFYETAAETAPGHNPTLHKLAAVYRKLGRNADARRLYEKELDNNRFEVPAVLGLVELDLAEGGRDALLVAERRLSEILAHLPDHAAGRVSLGVVQFRLGRREQAMSTYLDALRADPANATAATNLAQLLLTGDLPRSADVVAPLRRWAATLPIAAAACAVVTLADGQFEESFAYVRRLNGEDGERAEARRLLLAALERYDHRHPNVPWSIALAVEVLLAEGNLDAADAFTRVFESRCREPACGAVTLRLNTKIIERREAAKFLRPAP